MEDVEAVLADVLQGKSDIPVHKVQTPRSSQWNAVSVGETVVVVEFRQILFVCSGEVKSCLVGCRLDIWYV